MECILLFIQSNVPLSTLVVSEPPFRGAWVKMSLAGWRRARGSVAVSQGPETNEGVGEADDGRKRERGRPWLNQRFWGSAATTRS